MIRMDDKLSKEKRERLLGMMEAVMEEDALRYSDAAKIIDVLLDACRREKAETEEKMLIERFRLQ